MTAAPVSPPHGALQLVNQDPVAPPRESIEVRTYVVFERSGWEASDL